MADLSPLLTQLRTLTPQEWTTVQARITAFHKLAGKPLPEPTTGDDYLMEGLLYELRRRGHLRQEDKRFWSIPPRYTATAPIVWANLESQAGPLKTLERVQLGRIAMRALADYLERGNIAVGAKLLMNCVDKVPVAIERSFPGYLRAGLLRFCWQGH